MIILEISRVKTDKIIITPFAAKDFIIYLQHICQGIYLEAEITKAIFLSVSITMQKQYLKTQNIKDTNVCFLI